MVPAVAACLCAAAAPEVCDGGLDGGEGSGGGLDEDDEKQMEGGQGFFFFFCLSVHRDVS